MAPKKRQGEAPPRPVVGDPSDPQGMVVMLNQFLDWLRARNYAERTVECRQMYLAEFINWAAIRGVARPNEVTRAVLERYQRYLYHYRKKNDQPLSFRSQHNRLLPLRSWFKWLTRNRHVTYNMAADLELPRLEHRLPKHVLTQSEVETVINQTNVTVPLGVRDRAILEVLYSTGMRRVELTGLQLYDVDGDRGTVMIRQGKGKKDRMVPIGQRALSWIDKYTRETRPTLLVNPSETTLFLTADGVPLAKSYLSQLVSDYVTTANLGKTGSCHLFRHTMATLMLEGGADIRFIQAMLGHANISTTQIYTQVSIRQLKRIHEATHPAKAGREADDGRPVDAVESGHELPEGSAEDASSLGGDESGKPRTDAPMDHDDTQS
ncbi:MAG: site-specific tyrosine recombinase XerC [Planctomycetota bacterium]|nr:site-specific tyrosine recombinase XerC [Planctomycetota bacterium]